MFENEIFRYVAYHSYSYEEMMKRQYDGDIPSFSKKKAMSVVMKKLLPELQAYERKCDKAESDKERIELLKKEVDMLFNIIIFVDDDEDEYPENEWEK
jgi:hypothetical protein